MSSRPLVGGAAVVHNSAVAKLKLRNEYRRNEDFMASQFVTTADSYTEGINKNEDEHEDAPDDLTEEESTEQEALSTGLAWISAPWTTFFSDRE
ncbi:unnamed protein product [Phytophthora fragariaefolia]|uniref:Unnamed protein product n=1 Tax=Phytophthora fragariaefolia TaxID=1490495 RepID=A0A9W6XC89_9STRA|nr:unnamed protein product [Phytophthora fragariaefolia]